MPRDTQGGQPSWRGLGIRQDRGADDLGPAGDFTLVSRSWEAGKGSLGPAWESRRRRLQSSRTARSSGLAPGVAGKGGGFWEGETFLEGPSEQGLELRGLLVHPQTRERGGPASLPAPWPRAFPPILLPRGWVLLIPRPPPSQSRSAAAAPVTLFIPMLGHLLRTIFPGELGVCPRGWSILIWPVRSLASSS